MELTKVLIEKAKACQSAEELIALAKENDIELSPEEAELYLQEFAEGELSDEELDNVAGGQDGCKKRNAYEHVAYSSKAAVQYIFNIGDIRQEFVGAIGHHTSTVKIVDRRAREYKRDTWQDEYKTERISGFEAGDWQNRTMFEK